MPVETVNIHAAKTHLSALADQAHAGATIIIAKAGKPWAKLVPLDDGPSLPLFGALEGFALDMEAFDALDAAVADAFLGDV